MKLLRLEGNQKRERENKNEQLLYSFLRTRSIPLPLPYMWWDSCSLQPPRNILSNRIIHLPLYELLYMYRSKNTLCAIWNLADPLTPAAVALPDY